jgi:hypothetical protein
MQKITVIPIRYINIEPAILPQNSPEPIVVLSFGGEEGPIEEKAVAISDARQMLVDLLDSLATLGDPVAQAIGEQYFSDQS